MVELKNGETYNGHLEKCDNLMNITLRELATLLPVAVVEVAVAEVEVVEAVAMLDVDVVEVVAATALVMEVVIWKWLDANAKIKDAKLSDGAGEGSSGSSNKWNTNKTSTMANQKDFLAEIRRQLAQQNES
ncbi:hypothetical protein LPJ78_002880 [Coemansia sp. RSA 989]|nr:hypothetical protein LPJ78_002880 [Coemansia sp. RSA 989]